MGNCKSCRGPNSNQFEFTIDNANVIKISARSDLDDGSLTNDGEMKISNSDCFTKKDFRLITDLNKNLVKKSYDELDKKDTIDFIPRKGFESISNPSFNKSHQSGGNTNSSNLSKKSKKLKQQFTVLPNEDISFEEKKEDMDVSISKELSEIKQTKLSKKLSLDKKRSLQKTSPGKRLHVFLNKIFRAKIIIQLWKTLHPILELYHNFINILLIL